MTPKMCHSSIKDMKRSKITYVKLNGKGKEANWKRATHPVSAKKCFKRILIQVFSEHTHNTLDGEAVFHQVHHGVHCRKLLSIVINI